MYGALLLLLPLLNDLARGVISILRLLTET